MRRAPHAGIAHLVERHLAKVEVASSSLVARSSSGIPIIAEFSPQGGNGAVMGIPSLPHRNRRASLADASPGSGAPVLRRIASFAAGFRRAGKIFEFFSKRGGLFRRVRI